MLDSPTLNVLQSALDYASVRQEALANNIANVNTPGYARKDASFDQVLAQASDGSSINAAPLDGLRTDPMHMALGGSGGSKGAEIVAGPGGAMRLDGNNVDLDVEMGRMAKNEIYAQAVSELIAGHFSSLKSVIQEAK